jgi:hypothetical protein
MAKKPTLDRVEILIARNETRLKRTMTALDKLKKQRARLLKTAVKTVAFEPDNLAGFHPEQSKAERVKRGAVPVSVPAHPTGTLPPVNVARDDLGIPDFLRRQTDADVAAAEAIKAEQAATKKAKAQGRIATMKAKKSGETRKMPLTGKAALALINEG